MKPVSLLKKIFLISVFSLFAGPFASSMTNVRIIVSDYKPFVTGTEKGAKGIVTDVITEAFKSVGTKVKFVVFPFPRAVSSMLVNTFDGGFFDQTTLQAVSKQNFLCSPFFKYNAVLFRKDSEKSLGSDDLSYLKGKKVGVLRGNDFEIAMLTKCGMERLSVSKHKSASFKW